MQPRKGFFQEEDENPTGNDGPRLAAGEWAFPLGCGECGRNSFFLVRRASWAALPAGLRLRYAFYYREPGPAGGVEGKDPRWMLI